jgi:hypothetical protein
MREFRTAVLRFLLFVEFPSLFPIQVALTTAFLKIPLAPLSVPSLLCYSTGAVLVGLSGGPLCGALPYFLTVGVAGASRRVRDYGSKKTASLIVARHQRATAPTHVSADVVCHAQ